jgi:protein ImuB
MRWIALHLPLLSLEAFAATLPAEQAQAPLALMDAHHITAVNAAAHALGVRANQKRATALALAPQLLLGQADAARDTEAVTAVAHAALAFTPQVCLQPPGDVALAPDTVLLEVQASLRYFGGLSALMQRLQAAVEPLGHRVQWAIAPTPLGAALLSRVHRRLHCADGAALQRALEEAPVWLLGPGRAHWEALDGMGLRTLGDLQRLPRDGLARRFGQTLLVELDRARGQRPDPREPLAWPERFASRLELFARADTTEQMLYGAGVLLVRMVAWLAARQACVRGFTLVMHHEPRWRVREGAELPPRTELSIALAEPSREAAHLQVLLRERLAALALPAPALELSLEAHDIVQAALPNGELFPTAASEREGLTRLIERLQARLGPAQVQRLRAVADHRPECASAAPPVQAGQPFAPSAPSAPSARAARPQAAPDWAPTRPVWLMTPPEPLQGRLGQPLLDGRALQLLSGPERIEAGWWDGALAERDYFIAQAGDGALVWIYRARLPRPQHPSEQGDEGSGWFLQGRFA